MIYTRTMLLTSFTLVLSGCGSINTVFRGDEVASQHLKQGQTYCESIPRVYSGLSYNFCTLNAPYQARENNSAAPALIPWPLIDFIPSGIIDTLVLPYTIYTQSRNGNIDI